MRSTSRKVERRLGDENNRAIGAGGVDGPLHVALADGVERGGAIVQDENGRVFEEDTDQCQPLPLPAGKVLPRSEISAS